MTTDELRAIAEHHRHREEICARASRIWGEDGGRPPEEYLQSQEHGDRGALLAFVRQVAQWDPVAECSGSEIFVCCEVSANGPHTPGCWWLIAQGVKGGPTSKPLRCSVCGGGGTAHSSAGDRCPGDYRSSIAAGRRGPQHFGPAPCDGQLNPAPWGCGA